MAQLHSDSEGKYLPCINCPLLSPSRLSLYGEALSMRAHAVGQRVFLAVTAMTFATSANPATIDVPPDGPEQMPLIYVHGYADDGSGWARDSLYAIEEKNEPLHVKYLRHYVYGPQSSPSRVFTTVGMPNWALQWWSTNLNGSYAAPDSTAEEGYAFLQDAQELLNGTNWVTGTWSAQNRPIPSALEVLTTRDFNLLKLAIWASVGSGTIVAPQWQTLLQFVNKDLAKYVTAAQLLITNTYNDSGLIDPRAQNFLDLLRRERRPGGKLADWRQVNVITHSMGSLMTRAMLHKAGDASREDSEFVANVIYNAPPFAGSTMGHLGQLYFGVPEFKSQSFADPLLNKLFLEAAGSSFGAISTARDYYDLQLELLLQPLGIGLPSLAETIPDWASPIVDALDNVPIGSNVPPKDLANTPVGDSIAFALNLVRPIAGALTGMAGKPGVGDLTPAGGILHLQNYPQNPDVAQFVTLGKRGFNIQLFPDDLAAVAANPSLIDDPEANVGQLDDTAVAVGSAKLLTTTDNFGPRMKLLGEFDRIHDDMIYADVGTIAPTWLETYLAPLSTLHLVGNVSVVDSDDRTFLVEGTAQFSFTSPPETRTVSLPVFPGLPFSDVVITVVAVKHQYRAAPVEGGEPSEWTDLSPGTTVKFSDLVQTHGLSNRPFYLEWRAVNARGGREMIRSATIAVIGEAPQVVEEVIHTPTSAEVHEYPRNVRVGLKAVRNSTVSKLATLDPGQLTVFNNITNRPEAHWAVRNPGTKALAAIFDMRGDVDYKWDDESFSNPTHRSEVNGLLVPLAGLPEGPHTLFFETSKTTNINGTIIVRRSPRQRVRVLVDSTAPAIQFLGEVNHPVGRVVGPRTPLRFTVEDVGSNGGTGTMTVPGHPNGTVPANTTFTLSETNLKQQMESAGLVGGFLDLTISARDAVNNARQETIRVFYDIAPPQITLKQLNGASPAGQNAFTTVQDQLQIAVEVKDAGAGFKPPIVQISSAATSGSGVTEPLQLGAIGTLPNAYGGTIRLSKGENTVIVSSRDFGDNLGTLSLTINRLDNIADQQPLDLLSPRVTHNTFFDTNGIPVLRNAGDIQNVSCDFHGDVFVFDSTGNAFIGGDTNSGNDSNRIRDVFARRRGKIERISVMADGTQSNDHSDSPAVSGNGRYAVFRSTATNLVPGANVPNASNLYLKDLDTGQIAVISRKTNGTPANVGGVTSFRKNAMTRSGRYVFFPSASTEHVSGLTDTNAKRDIFMVDLDPNADGNFFEDNYVTRAISTRSTDANRTSSGDSFNPRLSDDGKHVVFRSTSTDIHADAASTTDGTTNAIRVDFAGSDNTGNLNVASRTVFPVNRNSVANSTGLTPLGVDDVAINPLSHEAAFSTKSNLIGSSDQNNQATGTDVYLALGNPVSPFVAWSSHSFDTSSVAAMQSSANINKPVPVALALHEPSGEEFNKVAWVSRHTNIEPNDSNGVEDLFIRINDTGTARNDLRVINWISNTQPSGAAVSEGGLTPDGRYAWWVTPQQYVSPYSAAGEINLYRRRLDPIFTKKLTIQLAGNGQGTVERQPAGTGAGAGTFNYSDTDEVTLTAIAEKGSRLERWEGVDASFANSATVRTSRDRTVTAFFTRKPPPADASADIQTKQDQTSDGVPVEVTSGAPIAGVVQPDAAAVDEQQAYAVSIVTQPQHGIAFVRHNLLYYTPNPGFAGNDSFTFTVTNNYGESLPAPVTANVTVEPVNYAPQSTSLTITVEANAQGIVVTPQVSDLTPGDTFTFSVQTQPANGTVTFEGNQFFYTPKAGFTGLDSFVYRVTDSNGNTIMGLAEITVQAPASTGRLANISTRMAIGTDENVLIAGFILTGNASKNVILRAIAPSLSSGGVPIPGTLQDPTLELRDAAGALLLANDDWRSSQEQAIIDTTIPPQDDRESALVTTLQPGPFTAIMAGKANATGIGLVELYDLGNASPGTATLANLSTRGFVQTGDQVMIGGFILLDGVTNLIVRAIGPSLTASGIVDALPDPVLELVNGNGVLVSSNDNWRDGSQEQQIIATTVQPVSERESAIVAVLAAGNYTAIIRGKDGASGVALVEVYALP